MKFLREDLTSSHVSTNSAFTALNTQVLDSTQAIRNDVEDRALQLSTELKSGSQATSLHIDKGVQDVREDIRQIVRAAQVSEEATTNTMLGISRCVTSTSGRLHGKIDGQNRATKQSFATVKKISAQTQKNQSSLYRQQKRMGARVARKLNALEASIIEHTASLTMRESGSHEIIFEGDNLGAITLPLQLIASDLQKAVQLLMIEGPVRVSPLEANWLREEFMLLQLRGHEAAAQEIKLESFNTSSRAPCHTSAGFPTRPSTKKGIKAFKKLRLTRTESLTRSKHQQVLCTNTGHLFLEIVVKDSSETADLPVLSSLVFKIRFLPKPGLSPVIFDAVLLRNDGFGDTPRITRLVQTRNIVPRTSAVFNCVRRDDVRGLRILFASKRASPFDCNDNGFSLLNVRKLIKILASHHLDGSHMSVMADCNSVPHIFGALMSSTFLYRRWAKLSR